MSIRFAVILSLAVTASVTGIYLIASVFHPPLLLFPHKRMVGATPVFSESPIPDEIEGVVGRADTLVRTSPLFTPDVLKRPVYLTNGGVRWRLLTLGSTALALSRPVVETIVVNRSNVLKDQVWYSGDPVPARDLSGVIAHERTHTLIRQRFGSLSHHYYPTWVVEGYADYVSGWRSMSDETASQLIAEGRRTQGLFFYERSQRIERELEANGGSVDELFRASLSGSAQPQPQQ
ncbi:hypothetical protein [Brevundimonas sp. TWP2-3-4b2]|uniref:hypothetical protein n=1 Tax=Brevundimonas sp. TWP2-3-4b2 TaxID=2804595 RepID=UPI003CF318D7